MNRKLTRVLGAFVAFAGVAAAPWAEAGVSHTLLVAPGPLLVRPSNGATSGSVLPPTDGNATWSQFNCVEIDYHGWLRMTKGCGNATGSTWRRGYVALNWAPNPGSGELIAWSGAAPTNTKLAGRAVSYNSDGTVAEVSGFIYGGGWKSGGVANRGDGAMFLEVAMQSSEVLTTTPELFVVGADVYAN